jgi:hypothetical protein
MAKKGKAKLPKQVAGVKVPKRLRKSGKSFAGLFKSPLGREILADALVAAAGAAAAALVRNRPSAAEVKDAGVAVADAGATAAVTAKDVAQAAVGAVGGVVAEAARQVLPTSLTGDSRDGDRERRRDRDRFAVLAAEGGRKKGKGKDKSREH